MKLFQSFQYWLVCLALLAPLVNASAYDRSAEVAQYLRLLHSDNIQSRALAATDLAWVGLSAPELFKVLAERIEQLLPIGSADLPVDLLPSVAALGGSGLEQFRPLLEQLAASGNRQLAETARQALVTLPESVRWNLIISDASRVNAQIPFSIAIYINMLESSEAGLVQRGAERVLAERLQNEYVLRAMSVVLQNAYTKPHSAEWLEAYGVMCAAIAYAGGPAYTKLLQRIAKDAAEKDLRKYAQKAMATYF